MARLKVFTTLALLGGSLMLAGCSNWTAAPPRVGDPITEPLNHPAVDQAASQGGATFTQAAANDYARLSDSLARQGNLVDSDYFARKGLAASRGIVVPPERPDINANWLIALENPYHSRTGLAAERDRLVAALDGGGRERSPVIAAQAQERYDCWIQQVQMDWQKARDWNTTQPGTCHQEFLAALGQLERPGVVQPAAATQSPPPAPARQYNVYFDFDKSTLTPEGRQIVDAAANAVRGDKRSRIMLVGKADLSGTDPYNLALSHRRADTVRGILLGDGLSAQQIDEHWVGLREPPVPTVPGVREPRNRVVEVSLH